MLHRDDRFQQQVLERERRAPPPPRTMAPQLFFAQGAQGAVSVSQPHTLIFFTMLLHFQGPAPVWSTGTGSGPCSCPAALPGPRQLWTTTKQTRVLCVHTRGVWGLFLPQGDGSVSPTQRFPSTQGMWALHPAALGGLHPDPFLPHRPHTPSSGRRGLNVGAGPDDGTGSATRIIPNPKSEEGRSEAKSL